MHVSVLKVKVGETLDGRATSLDVLLGGEPGNALAIAPFPMALGLIFLADKDREAVHLSFLELSDVDVPICELEFAFTVFLAISVMPLVLAAIDPFGLTLAFDAPLYELSRVRLLTLFEVVCAQAIEESLLKVALIV